MKYSALLLAATAAASPHDLRAQTAAVRYPLEAANRLDTEVRMFPLHYLRSEDAAKLIAPFTAGMGAAVFESGRGVAGITVRSTRSSLATIDSMLRAHDRPPPVITLRFHVIAAVDSAVRDPAIPSRVDGALRDVFTFSGYRLLGQGVATVSGHADFAVSIGGPGATVYEVNGVLWASPGGTQPSASSAGRVPESVTLEVRLAGTADLRFRTTPNEGRRSLLGTSLSVPVGHTVALGSAAGMGEGRAIILTVQADPLSIPAGR